MQVPDRFPGLICDAIDRLSIRRARIKPSTTTKEVIGAIEEKSTQTKHHRTTLAHGGFPLASNVTRPHGDRNGPQTQRSSATRPHRD